MGRTTRCESTRPSRGPGARAAGPRALRRRSSVPPTGPRLVIGSPLECLLDTIERSSRALRVSGTGVYPDGASCSLSQRVSTLERQVGSRCSERRALVTRLERRWVGGSAVRRSDIGGLTPGGRADGVGVRVAFRSARVVRAPTVRSSGARGLVGPSGTSAGSFSCGLPR